MSVNREIHSVIVNLNKNFSNNIGSDFSTIVNRQLEIKPDTEVALYGGNIVRAPVVLDRDVLLRLKPQNPVPYNINQDATGRANTLPAPINFTATLPKGEYSRLAFSKLVARKINEQIFTTDCLQTTTIQPFTGAGGETAFKSFPYRLEYKFDTDTGYYLGLRYFNGVYDRTEGANELIQDDPYRVAFLDLNDNFNDVSTSNIAFEQQYPNAQTVFTNSASDADWNSYLLGNSPIRGMCYNTFDDKDAQEVDVGFASTTLRGDPTKAGTARFCFTLSNTLMASEWAEKSVSVPAVVQEIGIVGRTGINAPTGLITVMFESQSDGSSYTQQSASVMINGLLPTLNSKMLDDGSTMLDDAQLAPWREICSVDLTQYNVKLDEAILVKYEIYCRNFEDGEDANYTNATVSANRKYYFKVRIQSPYEQGTSAVIYDSMDDGIVMNKELVEDGYMWQNIDSPINPAFQVSAGLCPQFYFYGAAGSFQVLNPQANNIASIAMTDDDSKTTFNIQTASLEYSLEALAVDNDGNRIDATNLANILGLVKQNELTDQNATDIDFTNDIAFNPNINPFRPAQAGLTVLNSDLMRYNIEVNLPVKAFNSTSSQNNDIGQSRTILYNVAPVIEEVKGAAGLINKNIEPNDTKYLSLNNPQPIKLNSLDIKIRRARTNEIATEISDCSLELLFRKE